MQTATRNGARARAINGDRDRAKSGLKLVFAFICGSISLRKVSRPVLLVAPIGTTRFLEGPVKSSVWSLVGPSRGSASSSGRPKTTISFNRTSSSNSVTLLIGSTFSPRSKVSISNSLGPEGSAWRSRMAYYQLLEETTSWRTNEQRVGHRTWLMLRASRKKGLSRFNGWINRFGR